MASKLLKLSDIALKPTGSLVSLYAVVKYVCDVQEIHSQRLATTLHKRSILLCDDTSLTCWLTIWNEMAQSFILSPGTVVCIKYATVDLYNGNRTLKSNISTSCTADQESEPALQLQNWYKTTAPNIYLRGISEPAIQSIADLLKTADTAKKYSSIRGKIACMSRNAFYQGCSQCMKKIIEEHCANCPDAKNVIHMALRVAIDDDTGLLWVTLFDKHCLDFFGSSVEDMHSQYVEEPQQFLERTMEFTGKDVVCSLSYNTYQYGLNTTIQYIELM
jgi:Replication protein A OB domain/Replication factor-A C terminal domain